MADEQDGRRRRRVDNRDAVLGALVALWAEGRFSASAAEIAERAGISPRSLFRYFDDVDDLNRAAIQRQQERVRPLVEIRCPPGAPLAERIAAVVAARVALFDAIAPAARAARVWAHRHEVVAAQVREGRSHLRRQLAKLFAPEIEAAGRAALPAADVLCSFEAYDLLRRDQGMSSARVRDVLTAALAALLDPTGGG